MAKYEISNKQLWKIFDRLERAGLVAKKDLNALPYLDENTTSGWRPREFLRCYPIVSLHVADACNFQSRAAVVDLSEKGIGLVGMETVVDQTKTLKLLPTILADQCRLHFTAQCRWTERCSPEVRLRSGFEITEIDGANLEWLRELIGTTTVCM